MAKVTSTPTYPCTSTFWAMFYSLIAHSESDKEMLRAKKALTWLNGELHIIRRHCSSNEIELLSIVHQHFVEHAAAPSYDLIKHLLERQDKPQLEEELEHFEELADDLRTYSPQDLGALLKKKADEHEQWRLQEIFKVATAINNGHVDIKQRGKDPIRLQGPKDAIKYFTEKLEASSLFSTGRISKGSLQENGRDLYDLYQENKNPASKRRRIPMGLWQVDDVIAFRKGHFVGILGYAGMRKTSFGRTWCYNAALAGNNVLHITLEQTFEEELVQYLIMHSHHPKWGGRYNITVKAFDDGILTRDEERFLFEEVEPDLKEIPGKLIISQPTEGTTWEALKTQLYLTDRETPIDMFFIDYLALCTTGTGGKDVHVQAVEANIRDAKLLALTFRDNEGLLVVTPVQANRDGIEDAKKNEGLWDVSAVRLYSEYDRSLDVLLSVFLDDDLKADGQIIIATAKTRRADSVKPFRAAVNASVGYITNLSSGTASESTLDDVIEDI